MKFTFSASIAKTPHVIKIWYVATANSPWYIRTQLDIRHIASKT